MAHAPGFLATARTVTRWQAGMGLASWRYMWRTTPVHRRQEADASAVRPPSLPAHTDPDTLQQSRHGVGPLFHRCYRTRICAARMGPAEVLARIADDPNRASPMEIAVFRKLRGADDRMEVGDEFLIRIAAPWDGPVRVVDRTRTSFRFGTLPGHLEAGQIEFRIGYGEGHLVFEIESWARSGDRLSYFLYDRARVAREMQLHMWTHFAERVARISGGRMTGGLEVITGRWEADENSG